MLHVHNTCSYFSRYISSTSPPLHLSGLTPGLLRVIHKQVGHQTKVTQAVLADKWRGVCLSQVRDGRDNNNVNLTKS